MASATSLTVPVTIDDVATPGGRAVTVTTGTEVTALPNGFTVPAGPPAITQVSPAIGRQGQANLTVTITGQYSNFVQGTTTVTFGPGITVGAVSVASPASLTVPVSIDGAAILGARPVTVTTGAEVIVLSGGFTILAPVPSFNSIYPFAGSAGDTNLSIMVRGLNTNFLQGASTVNMGAGIATAAVTVSSKTLLYVTITIDAAAVPGKRTLTVITGTEVISLSDGFTINAGYPTITASPSSIEIGRTNYPIAITGQFTNFAQGVTTVEIMGSAGCTLGPVTVASPTSLTVPITIAVSANLGQYGITVRTGSEVVRSNFIATAGAFISSVNPASALQGAQAVSVAVTGQNTHFATGTPLVSFGEGIFVSSVSVASATSLTAQVSVASGAAVGSRDVTVSTGTEQVMAPAAFTVVGAPALTQVNPSVGGPNQSLSVVLTGVYTNFVEGLSQVSFGAGITVDSVTVSGPTSLTAHITTAPAAALGLRTVTVTTGAEVVSVAGGFGVTTPAGAPTVTLASPADGSSVTSLTSVTGTVASPVLKSWTLDYATPYNPNYTTIATGAAPVTNGSLGTFDPTLLANGSAVFRLRATDLNGQTATTSATLVIEGNAKVGSFSIAFRDLSVPLPEISLDVIRTYDTRKLAPGSLGVGWSLSLQSITVRENRVLGKDWLQASSGGAFPAYCLREAKPHIITVTMPDNTVHKFQPVPDQTCQSFAPIEIDSMSFQAMPGTTATLEALDSSDFLVSMGATDLQNLGGSTFDVRNFLLTTRGGTQYVLNTLTGLSAITEPNGNTISITADGIFHSAGKGVFFRRDTKGRITEIVDPDGNILEYGYDARNDLAWFTDREYNTTTYSYNGSHGLLAIRDPRGITPLRNVYDDNGRLIQQVDGDGNAINFAHNLNTRQEVITDRLGRATVYEYDSNGNIVRETNPMGHVTLRTFDANSNLLAETDPLGHTHTYTYDAAGNRLTEQDPLGNTFTSTYDAAYRLLTRTDPLGRVTTRAYDVNGNLLSTQDAAGNVTTYTANAQGLPLSKTDALGYITNYQYDANGFLVKQTNPLGVATSYTYDANGNRISESITRTTPAGQETLVTQYQYDNNGKRIKTISPDGSTVQNTYDSASNLVSETDQRNYKTTYALDAQNRLVTTQYPLSASESTTYDANGQKTSWTDAAGLKTVYQYDAAGRQIQIVYADNASTSVTYDDAGQVTGRTDALGHTTTSTYDAAGRLTQVADAQNHITTYTYDAAGNRLTMTDAAGHITSYLYDALNRLVRTTYPDNTFDSVVYDALGRATTKTDQAGRTTEFQYDGAGRMIRVIDALGQVTQSAYDEVGNRISQTDANGHTTLFSYDKMGRLLKRTLPGGQFETFTYDAAGNQLTRTDFNGKTTTYAYDTRNRLLTKTPDPSFSSPAISYGYTATGKRSAMVDALGATSYAYDARDRLLSKSTPLGALTYTWTQAGNLASIRSSNTNGTSVNYAYDTLGRLASVTDNVLSATTANTYDAVGNLTSVAYPNGVTTSYTYNALNRLTNVAAAKGATPVVSYTYTVGAAGNRTAVAESGGRSVTYTCDALYRLTGETIAGDPAANNGAVTYTYDPVGNRLTRSSTLAAVPSAAHTYDANDRLATDTYDANGNTLASSGNNFTYDFEDHLKTATGGVSYVYDGDGRRIRTITPGGTVSYLIDDVNPTGLPQVLEEISNGAVRKAYTYGLNRIGQRQVGASTSYYLYDGRGSVHMLADTSGIVTDAYTYDAFGLRLSASGSTSNDFQFSGEQYDPNLQFYYMRARYENPNTGRFLTLDPAAGDIIDPPSLHQYTYAGNDPVNKTDPLGTQFTLMDMMSTITVGEQLATFALPAMLQGTVLAMGIEIFWAPAFDARFTALDVMASATNDLLAQKAMAQYRTANAVIAIGSAVMELGSRVLAMSNATISVAKSVVSIPISPVGNAIAATGDVLILTKSIQTLTHTTDQLRGALDPASNGPGILDKVKLPASQWTKSFGAVLKLIGKFVSKIRNPYSWESNWLDVQ